MRIMLVNPKFPYKGRDKFPVGLAYLAAIAQRFGEVRIVDENIGMKAEEHIDKYQPDIVGITSTTPSFSRAAEIGRYCKDKGIKVIFGGVHATFRPAEALSASDIVVRGEGEKTLEEILLGVKLSRIKGISFKENGKIFHNPPREFIVDLDSLPLPAYDMFPLKEYKMMSMVTSRGCFYNCSYCCATRFWGQRVRFHSVERVVTEFELIEDLGFKLLKIHDSTFTLDKERVMKICDGIIEKGIDISWSCETRADHLDEKLLKKMKEAGCSLICMGIDSADETVLLKNKRVFNLKHAEKVFQICKEIGIRTRAYVVFGLEGESEKSVKKTLEFLERVKPDQIMLSLATAYPGTELEKGKTITLEESWVAKFEGHGRGAQLYLPSSLSLDEYKRLADYVWQEIKTLKKKIMSNVRERISSCS
jgi:radical SAM superfamily enzyme YgiQ (UPF0313 family)